MRTCVAWILGSLAAGLAVGFWFGQRPRVVPPSDRPPLLIAEPAKRLPLRLPDVPPPPVELPPKEPATPEVAERLETEFHLRPRDRILATWDLRPPECGSPSGEAVAFSPPAAAGVPDDIELRYRWEPPAPPRLFAWDGELAIDGFLGQDLLNDLRAAHAFVEAGRVVVKGELAIGPRVGWMHLGDEDAFVVGVGGRMSW